MSETKPPAPVPPERYHYDAFLTENFEPILAQWSRSPALGEPAPDFPLWRLEDRGETTLLSICKENAFTVVEFGSFT